MDFALSEEQRTVVEEVRRFAENEIAPVARHHEDLPGNRWTNRAVWRLQRQLERSGARLHRPLAIGDIALLSQVEEMFVEFGHVTALAFVLNFFFFRFYQQNLTYRNIAPVKII